MMLGPHDCKWLHTVQMVWNVQVCAVHFEQVQAEHFVQAVHPVHAVQPPVQCVQSVHVHPVQPIQDGSEHPMQLGKSEQSVHSVQSQLRKSEQSPHSTEAKSVQSPQEMPSGSQPEPKSQLNPQLKSHCALGEPVFAAANTVIIRSLILNAMRATPGERSLVGVGVLIYHAE